MVDYGAGTLNTTCVMIKDGDVGIFEKLPNILETQKVGWFHNTGTADIKCFAYADYKFSSDIFVVRNNNFPTTEDAWESMIMHSSKWLDSILNPSEKLITLHKLLWEV